ncbi:hypothetical protein GCM10018980_74050 [Streptomyces capoamus]|uniref:Uncharacterized protein n=1 Tax=Streptomyces capoamus TaxID=68183 RepID=A0A919F3M9_9ACTN|nr:hypothetical protein [Streptomyces capoamus]GGP32774.1 hypothetical protein GCM10010501_75810 [Streptomyces libani subsp. rufus]GHG76251.1 hypothetical protein GCM10018980_74050 [Streptomyces capoamus]
MPASPIASPAFGTSCVNQGGPAPSGTTAHGTGAANGDLAGLPMADPFNHCGGAELSLGGEVDLAASLVAEKAVTEPEETP